MLRAIARVLSLLLLIVTGVLGVYNGISEWGSWNTPVQASVTVGVLLYGILGLSSAFGLFRRRRWSVWTTGAWGVAVTYVPGVAVTAYGQGGTMIAAIAASAASALIALAVVWTTRAVTPDDPERPRS